MGMIDRLMKSVRPMSGNGVTSASVGSLEADALLEQGIDFENKGLLKEALHSYDTAIRLTPTFARAHFNRGTILLDQGDADLALESLNVALSLKPDSVGTLYNIGNAQMLLKRPDAALVAFKRALALKPDFGDAQVALQEALAATMDAAEKMFQQALNMQDAERHAEAEATYRNVISINPDHVAACNNLGGLLFHRKELEEALQYFQRAAEADPSNADAQINLGDVLQAMGKKETSIERYRRALEISPRNVVALIRLGNIQSNMSQLTEAATSYRQALSLAPHNAEANLNLCSVLIDLGQPGPAEVCCRDVLTLEPDCAEAHNNLGLIMKARRQDEAAIACFQKALSLKVDFSSAHINLGSLYQTMGKLGEAQASYRAAIAINPDAAAAHSNYGNVLQSLGHFEQAKVSYFRALELEPDLALAHNNLGTLYERGGNLRDAATRYERAIKLKPDYAEAYSNFGGVLKDMGRLPKALEAVAHAIAIDASCILAHNNLLFIQNYVGHQTAEQLLADAKRFGAVVTRQARPFKDHPNSLDPLKVLKVGFVSGDLGNHPVGYFLESVLSALQSQSSGQLEVFAYPTFPSDDETSKRLKACCQGWHSAVGLSDEALAKRIHQDGIDILIDLAGHTAHNRLPVFAWKPAPIQVSWLGYCATTGVAEMDYYIADAIALPSSLEGQFVESIWRLPESYLCLSRPNANVPVVAAPALTSERVTFGSFNNLTKMTDETVHLWARILHAVPQSRLFLKSRQLGDESVLQATLTRYANHGIGADRLILEGHVNERGSHLAAYNRVDIALDPFPYNGVTTTAEALWMGVPVLTLAGDRFLARQGVSLLTNAGLPDWIASDLDDYVDRAMRHAGDLRSLATLRSGLRQQVLASPIFDAARFAAHFEAALRGMWEKWTNATASASRLN